MFRTTEEMLYVAWFIIKHTFVAVSLIVGAAHIIWIMFGPV